MVQQWRKGPTIMTDIVVRRFWVLKLGFMLFNFSKIKYLLATLKYENFILYAFIYMLKMQWSCI